MDVPSHSGRINLASFLSRLSAWPFAVSPFEPMLPFKPVLIACGDLLLSPYWGMSMSVEGEISGVTPVGDHEAAIARPSAPLWRNV
jgi:hypothetical protein